MGGSEGARLEGLVAASIGPLRLNGPLGPGGDDVGGEAGEADALSVAVPMDPAEWAQLGGAEAPVRRARGFAFAGVVVALVLLTVQAALYADGSYAGFFQQLRETLDGTTL
jgi:hypothetical protein